MHGTSSTTGTSTTSILPTGKVGWAKAIAIFTIALGLVVLSGWALDIDALKRLLPGLVSMKANTAAAFAVSGIGLYLHTLRQISPATLLARRLGATLVLLLGLVTLCEYHFGWDAGIDQLLFSEPAGEVLTSHPGRMSTITATSFALVGSALLLMEATFWMAAQAAAFAVAASALLPLGGYMFGNLSPTHIGNTTAIAAHTAAGFLILSMGILAAMQNHGLMLRLRKKSLVIGLAISLITLIVIFGAASYNFVQKGKASQWVEHTYEVIQGMESFSASLHDFLNHNRGFLITGDERQLTERNASRDAMLAELAKVYQLTSHNAVQQERLAALDKLVRQRVERADLVVRVRREKGLEAAAAMIFGGKGDTLTDEIEAKLDELENTEKDLLKERQRVAEVMSSSSLFTLGTSAAASLLLLLWVFRTSQREITERKQAEEALRESEARLQLERDNLQNIVGSMGDGVYIVNADYDIEYINPIIEKIFGPVGGRKCYEYFHDRTESCPWCKNPEVFAGKSARWEWTSKKTGQTFDLYDAPLRNPDGSISKIEFFHDITDFKRAEEALRKSEEQFRAIFENAAIGIARISTAGQFLEINEGFCKIIGYTREEVLSQKFTFQQITFPEDLEPDLASVNKLLDGTGDDYVMEKRYIRKDGSIAWVNLSVHLLRDNERNPLYFISAVQDITERKQAEVALRASEERLHAIIETSMDAIVQIDANGIITGWNIQMEKVFGWTRAEAIGRTLHETIIPPQHREAHVQGLKHFLLTGEGPILNKRMEVVGLHRDGHVFPVELTVTPLKIRDRYEFSAFLRNITERKRHENIQLARLRLMQSAARLSLKELFVATLDEACALTGSSVGFYHFLDADQKTLSLQAWSTRTTREFCKAEGEGSHYDIDQAGVWVDCVRERRPVIHNDYAALPNKRGMPPGHAHVEREMVVPIFRNELIVAILGVGNKAAPYKDNDLDSVTQLADLAWDIAVAKRASEEVRRLNAELERRVVERTASLEVANKDMESFSYSISHDLRAPLRAINGFSKILQEEYVDRLDDEGKRLLNVVGDNAQKMGELIDDILAFSRAGRNEINRSVINMEKMVAGVWEELKPDMAGRDVRLELRDIPPTEGDAAMMHQVIFNLLSNAVKFTQHRADARIEVGGHTDEHETIYHVKDNGVGFDMQYADKLFGVFLRLHGMDEFEGTGIGLAIVKRIITKHGGRVWAEGKVNEGATIYFSLPDGNK